MLRQSLPRLDERLRRGSWGPSPGKVGGRCLQPWDFCVSSKPCEIWKLNENNLSISQYCMISFKVPINPIPLIQDLPQNWPMMSCKTSNKKNYLPPEKTFAQPMAMGFNRNPTNPRPWMVFSGFVTSLCDLWINLRGGGR